MEQEQTRHQRKYWNNVELYRAKGRAQHAKNREKSRAQAANWKANNKERVALYAKTLRSSPRGRAMTIRSTCEYASRKKGIPCNLTNEHILELLNKALATGVVTLEFNRPDSVSIDKIVPALGYVIGNVQIVPWWYNAAKHDFSAEDLHAAMDRWRAVHE